jgi:type I restriction enzyme S subunit
MSYLPYQHYRTVDASGVAQIPNHWGVKRLRFAAQLNPSRSEINLPEDALISFVPMDAVAERGGLALENERPLEEVGAGYTYFADGDVVVAKITPCFENGKGALASGLTSGVALGTTELHVIRAHGELDAKFLFYISISDHFRRIGESEMYGAGGQKRIPDTFIKDFRATLPPLPEQLGIISFLDHETAWIDVLIDKKRRVLERLEEKRLAVITHAVTKGLNPVAPMKNSGIDWLGNVPTHWEIKKIKYAVSHVVDCLHTTPHYDGDLRYPAVRTADVDRGRLLLDQVRLVSEEVYRKRIQRLKPVAGDILYSREGERFGMAALVPPEIDLCLGQRMMMFRSLPDMQSDYLMWALNSEAIYQQVILYTGGATSPHINICDIINFAIPCPPKEEQIKIAEHIDRQCRHIEKIIKKLRSGIEMFQEYRSVLITNAVTGKINVCGTVEKEAAA